MHINNKNTNYNPQFGLKFLNSQEMHSIVEYAIKTDHSKDGCKKFNRLNEARKILENVYPKHKINLRIYYKNDIPTVIFSRYVPKSHIAFPDDVETDYRLAAQLEFELPKNSNPLKHAYHYIIKMSNNAPNNKLFQKIVALKGKIIDPLLG